MDASAMDVVDQPSALPACLQYLSQQTGCALGPVGVAAMILPDVEMMREARLIARDNVPALDWMLVHGRAGGRIYAALLFEGLGPDQGKAAWTRLLDVDDWVTVAPGGCNIMRAYVSDFAKSELSSGQLFAFRQEDGTLPAPSRPAPRRGSGAIDVVLASCDRVSRAWETLKSSRFVFVIPMVAIGGFLAFFYLLRACVGP